MDLMPPMDRSLPPRNFLRAATGSGSDDDDDDDALAPNDEGDEDIIR